MRVGEMLLEVNQVHVNRNLRGLVHLAKKRDRYKAFGLASVHHHRVHARCNAILAELRNGTK